MATQGNGLYKPNVKDRQCFTRFNKQGQKYTACKDNKQQLRMTSAKKRPELTKKKVKPTVIKKPKGTIVKPKAAAKPKKPKAPTTKEKRPRGRPKGTTKPPKAKPLPKKRGRKSLGITAAKRAAQDKKTAELKSKRAAKAKALAEKRAAKALQVKRNKAKEAERLSAQREREEAKAEKQREQDEDDELDRQIYGDDDPNQVVVSYLGNSKGQGAFKVSKERNDQYRELHGVLLTKEKLYIDRKNGDIYRIDDGDLIGKKSGGKYKINSEQFAGEGRDKRINFLPTGEDETDQ